MTKISNATLVASATDGMKMPTGEVGDLAVSVGQIKTNVLVAVAAAYDPIGSASLASLGTTLQTAAADTPLEADTFNFYDAADAILKKITWANFKATLKTYFDALYWKVTGTTTITGPTLIAGVDANQVTIQNTNTGSYETSMTVGSGAAELLMGTNANHYSKFRVTGSLATTGIAQMYVEDDNSDYITLSMYSSNQLILDSSFADFAGIKWTGWNSANFSADTLVPNGHVNTLLAAKAPIASPTFTGTVTTPAIIVSSETASRIAHLDASKNIKSLDTATYPTLAELAFIKGLRAKPARTILYKNNVQASNGGSTSEVIVDSFPVPGGTMGANDNIDIDILFSKSAQNNTFVTTIYVNTSSSLVGATQIATYNHGATIRYSRMFRTMWFRNSVSSQSIFSTTASASNDDYVEGAAVLSSLSIDFSTEKYFIIAIDGGASDICYVETSLFEIVRS